MSPTSSRPATRRHSATRWRDDLDETMRIVHDGHEWDIEGIVGSGAARQARLDSHEGARRAMTTYEQRKADEATADRQIINEAEANGFMACRAIRDALGWDKPGAERELLLFAGGSLPLDCGRWRGSGLPDTVTASRTLPRASGRAAIPTPSPACWHIRTRSTPSALTTNGGPTWTPPSLPESRKAHRPKTWIGTPIFEGLGPEPPRAG